METAARIFVLVERGAIETGKSMLVGRKMCGHPVEDNADAVLMRAVDEARKSGRIAEAGGRRVKPGRLVAP